VALKVMLPRFAQDEKAKTRFLREARSAGKLQHDNVVSIHQVGEANGVPFIAMEFLKGAPLDKYLKEKGDLPLPTVLRIGREIALGLQAAHKLGMIHRDIKPANVWLEAPKGRVKILDFGLARREEDGEAHLTQSGAIVGTPAYMAPEQASGEKLDGRADLFSLGVLLYRLTTGQAAFTGPTTTAMLLQVMTHEPSLASEVKATVPLEMSRIIAKLMAKKRDDRYGSAAEFLADWEKLMRASAEPRTIAEPRPLGSGPASLAKSGPQPTLETAAARDAVPLPDGRGSDKRWLALGVCGLLVVAVAGWFLIPRGTTPGVVVKGKENPPPVVEPPAQEPPPLDATNAAEVQTAWSAKLKLPVEAKSPSGISMMLIPPGDLVKYPYYLGKYEVTQAEWQKVMGYNPSSSKGPNLPVEMVNWFDCVEFCNKLSEKEGLPAAYELTVKLRNGPSIEEAEVKILGGPGYRIPTDPEWEHACLAGTQSKYCFGADEMQLADYAWYSANSGNKTHPVGELKANGFGLYDIHGNVREWNEEILKNDTKRASMRVLRGGNWNSPAAYCAVSNRTAYVPVTRYYFIGLRLAKVP
jgi:hypothetical protein